VVKAPARIRYCSECHYSAICVTGLVRILVDATLARSVYSEYTGQESLSG
jgi:hypothetical protein